MAAGLRPDAARGVFDSTGGGVLYKSTRPLRRVRTAERRVTPRAPVRVSVPGGTRRRDTSRKGARITMDKAQLCRHMVSHFRARARASGTPPLRHVDAREFLDETPYPETRWSSRREVDNRGGPGRSGTSAPASGRSPRAGQATPFAGRAAHYTIHERVRIEVRPGQRRGAAPAPAGKWWVPATRASARGVARTADRRTDQRGSPVRPRHGNLPGGAARGRVAAAGGHSGPWSFRASVVVSASFGFLLLQATGRADRHLPSPSVNVHQLFWGSERRRARGRAIAHGKPSGCNAIR